MGRHKHEMADIMDTSRLTINEDESEKKTTSITPMLAFVCFLSVFGSSFVHGYSTGVLNAPQYTIQTYYNDSHVHRYNHPMPKSLLNFLWALTVSIYLMGGIVGIFSVGFFADKLGRRGALQFSHIFTFVAAVFFGIARPAGYYEFLMVGRLVLGFSAGMGSGLVPMYLTESSPRNLRGSLGVLHQLGLVFGIFLSQVLGLEELLGDDETWPVLLVFTAVPGLVATIFLPLVPESPRYLLVIKNDVEKTKKALISLRGAYHDVKEDLEEMREEQIIMEKEPPWTVVELLRAKKLRRVLIVTCGLQMCQQFSGISVIFYYSTDIFQQAGIPLVYVRYATLGTGAIKVMMTIITVYLMEKAGRRSLLLSSLIGMGISSAVITIALNLLPVVPLASYISLVCTFTFIVSFAIGLGPIPHFLGGELFKQGPRPAAMSFSGMLNWVANFVVGISFPSLQSALKAFTFMPFVAVITIAVALTFKYVKETKSKTYKEIADIYYEKGFQNSSIQKTYQDGGGQ